MADEQPDNSGFARPEPSSFNDSLSTFVRAARSSGFDRLEYLLEALRAISDSPVLGPREQDTRASAVLAAVPLDDRMQHDLAIFAREIGPAVRNAIARALPPKYRQLSFTDSPVAASPAAHRDATSGESTAEQTPSSSGLVESGIVLLIGTLQEHEHNCRILEPLREEGIEWIRAKSPADVDALLTEDVVAISIGRSCWSELSSNEHERFLERICQFSSFAFLRIDATGYADPSQFDHTCSIARYRGPGLSEVSHGDSPNISETDLPRLRNAANAFSGDRQIHLYPADIPPNTARILIAGVRKQVDHRHFPNSVHLRTIGTKTMQGGRSQALLVQAHPDDAGPPLVVKVAELSLLCDEMNRFRRFIQPWDGVLRPQLHFHGNDGLVIFGLVDTPGQPGSPAPTFESHLEAVLRAENGNPAPALGRERLFALVDRTIQKVASLNSRHCTSQLPSLAWMTLEPLDACVARGLRWEFSSGDVDPIDLARAAASELTNCGRVATVHGDLHLRNILVRDESDPFLIDYAYSGPGHPCFDLVWFESALLFRFFRMMTGEQRISGLLRRALDPSADFVALHAEYSNECTSIVNQAALYAAIKSREACLQLLDAYSLSHDHYRLMKLLVACQSLIRLDVQTGIVRAMIFAAVSPAS